MARLSDLLINPDKGNDGVDFPYDHGVVWKVARWGNPRFRQEIQKEILRLPEWKRRKFQEGLDEEAISDTIVRRAFGKSCLVGWSGLEDATYSEAKAVELCCDQAFDPVYRELVAFAQRADNYRDNAVEEAAGNSLSSSSGSSNGDGTNEA